ncbi:tyrosine-type recombinase/integrase [Nocardia shimofusensis]|uniref:tyrosine-type recombinase/integrase n=1 Tax=Nocardia shimofusensis TaxID=228596 RepID=UPI0009FE45C7|nr:site-specific integrase [Nocardia shimofusensis]
MTTDSARESNLIAARLLLERLDLKPEDLQGLPSSPREVPTFAEYIPVVLASMPVGHRTRTGYNSYWRKLLDYGWADRRIDEPTVTELKTMVEHFRTTRQVRRADRGGRGTVTTSISALRYLYRYAINDGFIDALDDPAARLVKPAPLPPTRRALPDQILEAIIEAADTTGDDPELDSLILRLHIETACRASGALSLRPKELDPTQCLILLREKRGTVRWQPVSPTLMNALLRHATERGAPDDGRLLRYRNGNPITNRRYGSLFERLAAHVPAVRSHGITAHWIRHTTLRYVERRFGTAVAKSYGGHSDNYRTANDIYTRAGIEEVARALSEITGEPHPLAQPDISFWRGPQPIPTQEVPEELQPD